MQKQLLMFQDTSEEVSQYTNKIDTPVYEPKNKKPDIRELVDLTKVQKLLSDIESSTVSESDKVFLRAAAWRHALFHYELIADYYAHSNVEVQRLMEQSALVIIDFNQAIERGFIRICENLREQYMMEYNDDCFR
jgi:hypothetical protein